MAHAVCNFQATFTFEVIHAPMPRKLGGNRACRSCIMPGLPTTFSVEIKCPHCIVPSFNSCTKCVGSVLEVFGASLCFGI